MFDLGLSITVTREVATLIAQHKPKELRDVREVPAPDGVDRDTYRATWQMHEVPKTLLDPGASWQERFKFSSKRK